MDEDHTRRRGRLAGWVVDTSVLIDVYTAHPIWGVASAQCLNKVRALSGLIIAPITYVELAPAFDGNAVLQDDFLRMIGVRWIGEWEMADTLAAHQLWADLVRDKRSGHLSKRPVGDVLIEAFAQPYRGIITRNPKHFRYVPVIVPA